MIIIIFSIHLYYYSSSYRSPDL